MTNRIDKMSSNLSRRKGCLTFFHSCIALKGVNLPLNAVVYGSVILWQHYCLHIDNTNTPTLLTEQDMNRKLLGTVLTLTFVPVDTWLRHDQI